MEDGVGNIQETGQEKRPARMVGLFRSESSQARKDASDGDRALSLRLKGEG